MKKDDRKEYIIEYNMVFITILSFIIIIPLVALIVLFVKLGWCKITYDSFVDLMEGLKFVIFFIVMILWMVLHEIIHGIAYRIGGADKNDIVFGASLENGVFYCKAKKYINKKCIMLSLLSPLVLIGIVTFIIGVIISNLWLIALSIINISGAAGDIVMFIFFLRQKDNIEFRELGFSSPAVVKTSEDITKNKYIGVKNIREVTDVSEVTEGEEKKVTISKGTWIFMAIVAVFMIIEVIMEIMGK